MRDQDRIPAQAGSNTVADKVARRARAIEGRPFGPGSRTEHEGRTKIGRAHV